MPFVIPGFASHQECQRLVELARARLHPSTVAEEGGKQGFNPVRSGRMAFLADGTDPLVIQISRRIAQVFELSDIGRFEDLQILCYGHQEEYKPHLDSFPLGTEWDHWRTVGGQRVATAILGLVAPEEGGATVFPNREEEYPVVVGQLLVFANVLEDELTPNELSRHGGAPVLRGEKWVATKWLRQRLFR